MLRHRLKGLERKVGKHIRPGRGRSWEFPHRKPAARGRDQLVLEVENLGHTSREAKRIVNTLWKVAAEGLKRDGELQVSPLGVLKVERRSLQYRQRFGREQVLTNCWRTQHPTATWNTCGSSYAACLRAGWAHSPRPAIGYESAALKQIPLLRVDRRPH